jgi:CRP/FNR family transcriptional regulator, cyclic AMP receptor protein
MISKRRGRDRRQAKLRASDVSPREQLFSKLLRPAEHLEYEIGETIYSQGDTCDGVYYVEEGLIKLTTVSERGRAAVLGFLAHAGFLPESYLAGRNRHQFTATASAPSSVLLVESNVMMRLIKREPAVAVHLVNSLLQRTLKVEEDLIDQLFNSSETRLARKLLSLADCGEKEKASSTLETMNHETLAEMVETTRPRVNCLMNKFRKWD